MRGDALWVVATAIALFGLLAYHRSFGNPFVFDDLRSIQENPTIRGLSWEMFRPPVPRAVTNRPVVNASFALNYAIGGLDVVSFHVLNLLIHMGAALLLFGIVRRTLELPSLRDRFPDDGASWIAGAIALLWLVHPLAGESVTYVVQRTESLMGLFYFLVLYCVIRGATGERPNTWYVGALVALVLGLGSKESMVASPLAVLVYDRMFLAPSFREALRRRAAFYGAIAAIVLLVVATTRTGGALHRLVYGHLGGRLGNYGGYLLTQCEAAMHYLRLCFWPWPIAGDYDDWPKVRTLAQAAPALLVVLALAAATAWGLLRRAPIAYLGAWFFLALLPTAVLPLHAEIVADRRMYLPLAAVVALCVFAGWAAIERLLPGDERRPTRRRVAASVTLALALALSFATLLRTLDFASGEAFWTRVVSARPQARRGRINLGYYTLWSGRVDDAIAHFETAVANDREDKQAHFGLAGALQRAGRNEAAIAEYREAIRIDSRYSKARWNLAQLLAAQGRKREADWHERVARNPRLVPKNWWGPGEPRRPAGPARPPGATPAGRPDLPPGAPRPAAPA
ncbi:MAG: tetratricopeptide repeat protein, partial [Alphaproteobacteria bacterium]